jgi:hypothetical protein
VGLVGVLLGGVDLVGVNVLVWVGVVDLKVSDISRRRRKRTYRVG